MKSLEETFKENQEKSRDNIKKLIKENKRQQIIDRIVFVFIVCAITCATGLLVKYACKDDGIHLQRCLDKGHSTNYCYKNL